MADIKDMQETDKSPLLKPKKTRPPPSEKQMENFKKMARVRAENVEKRKAEKLLEAQKALLEKNGIKVPPPKPKLKEKEQAIQFEIEEQDETTEEEIEPPLIKATPKQTQKKQIQPKARALPAKQKVQQIIEEDETDYSSDSSEEVIVIKRGKKKPKNKVVKKQVIEEDEEEQQEYVANSPTNYINYFC